MLRRTSTLPYTSLTKPLAASAQASEPLPLESVKLPAFPELPGAATDPPTNASMYLADLVAANAGAAQPACRMQLRIYLPSGDHPPRLSGAVS